MVNIKLDNTWTLTSDSKQWLLCKEGRSITYHSQLENAILSYFELKMRGSSATTMSGLLQHHKLLCARLCNVLTLLQIEVVGKKITKEGDPVETQAKPLKFQTKLIGEII